MKKILLTLGTLALLASSSLFAANGNGGGKHQYKHQYKKQHQYRGTKGNKQGQGNKFRSGGQGQGTMSSSWQDGGNKSGSGMRNVGGGNKSGGGMRSGGGGGGKR